MTGNLESLIETLCRWVWDNFHDVSHSSELQYIGESLELASIAADNNDRVAALRWLSSPVERVFGVASAELDEFERVFNADGSWWVNRSQFDRKVLIRMRGDCVLPEWFE